MKKLISKASFFSFKERGNESKHSIKSKLILFIFLLASFSLRAVPTLPNESNVQVTLYVSPNGNDSNSGSQSAPFLTIGKAWSVAIDNLKAARGTKISIADGTYDQGGGQLKIGDIAQRSAAQDVDHNNDYDINVAGISDSNLKNTILVIEGQNAGKAIITGSADQVIWINGKYNFVMRNITMKGCAKTTIQAGSWEPISDTRYWLLDNCSFIENAKGSQYFIASIQTVRDITMRNCKFNDNYGNGVYLVLMDAQVDNCEFNNNLRSLGESSFGVLNGYAGGLNFSGLNVVFNSCKINDNGGIGFQTDLVGKNVTFNNCEFNNNGHSAYRDGLDPGFKWEIAEGPVYINNCKINDNATGVQLETAQNFYFDKCQIQNNTITQVKITWKNRTVIDNNNSDKWGNGGTGDLSLAPGKIFQYRKVINGTLNSNFTNNCISTTKGATSYLYLRRDDTLWDLYTNWFTNEFHGNNNTYYSSSNTNVFNTNQAFTDLQGWKNATGEDAASIWSNTCNTSACTAPAAPSGLNTVPASSTQINLSWSDNSSNETGFLIERRQGSGSYTTVTTTAAGANTYSDAGLSANTSYTYRVSATGACNSPASNESTATTPSGGSSGGSGTGLKAEYYNSKDLSGSVVITRTDATVNNDWGTGSPGSGISADNFSARWTGKVKADFSQTYTFYTTSDDGIRLWVNGQQLINNWTDHAPIENSGSIALTAGQQYDIKLEFYENAGGAVAKLSWSSSSLSKQIIAQGNLYPAGTTSGGGGGSTGPLSRTGWVAAAFASIGSDTPDKAIDGNTGSKWSSGNFLNPGQWFQVNMGSAQTFNKVEFDAGAGNSSDYARGFNIYVSNDGSSWGNPIASGTGTSRDIVSTFSSQTAQYIRIEQTGSSGQFWWAINEFNVYNTASRNSFEPLINGNSNAIVISPNPARESFNISFNELRAGEAVIELRNTEGKIQRSQKINVQVGMNNIHVPVSDLREGIYILFINSFTKRSIQKVIITK